MGLALIVLHLAGALRHQLLLKDGLLRRMAPGGKAALAFALLALVVATYFGTGMYVARNYLVPSMEREVQAEAPAEPEEIADERPEELAVEAAPEPESTPETQEAPAPGTAGTPPVWAIHPGGRLSFTVGSGDMQVRGSFSDWSGAIRFDPDRTETANIRIDVRLASAAPGDATMDDMLQGPDFFGTSANPAATWRSNSVRRTGPNRYSANGTLSLKGVSRPQSLTFSLAGDGLRRSIEGSASIDRTAFGVGTGDAAAGLSGTVSLSFAFEAVGLVP